MKVNESKIENYIERMQQLLVLDQLNEEFKNISKAGFANTKS